MDHRGVAGNVTEFDGNLGLVIGAGGGSLTLFDAVRKYGGKPANYCEIGGNPSVAKAAGLAKLVLSKPGVDKIAVMMSDRLQHARRHRRARRREGLPRARLRPGREDRDLPHPRRLGGRGLQDPREVRRRVLRPLRVDARGGAARGGEDPGSGRMSILIDENTTFIVQGITGREAVNLTRECLDYGKGAKVVGGVTPGPQGPRRARRAGVRHRRAGGRAPRRADQRLGRHRPPRLHQGRGVRGARARHQADRDRHRAHPAPRRRPDGRARRREGRAHHRPQLPRRDRPRRDQDGRHRRPREGRGQGLHARVRSA